MAKQVSSVINKMIKEGAEEIATKGVRQTSKNAGKKALTKSLILDDKHGRHLGNLFTGKKLNGYTIGAAGVGAGLMMTGGTQGLVGPKNAEPYSASDLAPWDIPGVMSKPVAPAEAAANPVMTADGTAGAENTRSQAPTLNASGDIVFGMHGKRKR